MGFSDTNSSSCRRHPNHRQSPGVCSSCLREKLSKLSNSPSSFNRLKPVIVSNLSSLSSSSPPYYSTASSSTASHRRNGSEAYVSRSTMALNNNNNINNGLKKSRSVSCANLSSKNKLRGNDEIIVKNKSRVNNEEVKKKNGGLLKMLGKKTKGVLTHSKTMKERPSSYSSANSAFTVKKNK